MVAFCGRNGAGKTNLLEAISLFSPGRGLRRAAQVELQNKNMMAEPWRVFAVFKSEDGVPLKIGTGRGELRAERDRLGARRIRMNGGEVRSQSALSQALTVLWLTPLEDRLWTGSPARRRLMLDRMTASLIPDHLTQLSRYERLVKEWKKTLLSDRSDATLLGVLEKELTGPAVAITAARLETLRKLNAMVTQAESPFPKGRFDIEAQDSLAQWLAQDSAARAEQRLREYLKKARQSGNIDIGPHRSDWKATFLAKNAPAEQSSTGEQKALLMNLILAQAKLVQDERGQTPILLLDEVCAHFDNQRRHQLFQCLADSGMQVFMTGTEETLFSGHDIRNISLA